MSLFTSKTWKDRITEYPTRRTLTKADGSVETVTGYCITGRGCVQRCKHE